MLLLRGFCRLKGCGSPLGTCKGLLEGLELTGQGSDFSREPPDFGLIGRDRLLKGLQLIRSSLLGGLQIMDRLSRFIRGRRICTTLRYRNGFVDA